MRSIIACLMFVGFGCKQNSEPEFATTDSAAVSNIQPIRTQNAPMPERDQDAAYGVDEVAFAKPSDKTVEQKIIREATLKFETEDLGSTYQTIQSAIKTYNAIVQNDQEGKDYESVFRNLTIRIPNSNFDAFLADVGKGIAYFDQKEISSQDVTEEFIDIDARLKAKKILEARYLELLKKANKVSEMLEIEKQLSEVREEIESKEGQMRYLKSRISMSTISITFYKKIAVEEGATVSYGSKMWNAVKTGFNSFSGFFIGLLNNWPFIVILVVLIYFLKRRSKRAKNV